jgi:hypothetical protein
MGMKDDVIHFLSVNPGVYYCGFCVAHGLNVTFGELNWVELVADMRIEFTEARCAKCLSVRTVIRGKVPPKSQS